MTYRTSSHRSTWGVEVLKLPTRCSQHPPPSTHTHTYPPPPPFLISCYLLRILPPPAFIILITIIFSCSTSTSPPQHLLQNLCSSSFYASLSPTFSRPPAGVTDWKSFTPLFFLLVGFDSKLTTHSGHTRNIQHSCLVTGRP